MACLNVDDCSQFDQVNVRRGLDAKHGDHGMSRAPGCLDNIIPSSLFFWVLYRSYFWSLKF